MLMGDLNEGIDSRENTYGKLTEMGLVNIMEEHIGSPLPKSGTAVPQPLTTFIQLLTYSSLYGRQDTLRLTLSRYRITEKKFSMLIWLLYLMKNYTIQSQHISANYNHRT